MHGRLADGGGPGSRLDRRLCCSGACGSGGRRAACKTVGSAYVGSNPTPATTCENGPLAGNSRLGGPFPSCHVLYQGVSLRVDVSRCPRTYSGRRRYRSRGRGHRRFSTDGHGRARQRAVQVRCRRYAPPGGWPHFGGAGAATEGGRAVRQAVAFAAPRERAARALARVPFQVGLSRCVIHQAGPVVPNPRCRIFAALRTQATASRRAQISQFGASQPVRRRYSRRQRVRPVTVRDSQMFFVPSGALCYALVHDAWRPVASPIRVVVWRRSNG